MLLLSKVAGRKNSLFWLERSSRQKMLNKGRQNHDDQPQSITGRASQHLFYRWAIPERGNDASGAPGSSADQRHGGILPEQPDPSRFQQVLDLGCGTGGWLIDLAKTLPTSTSLVGVDVSERLL